MVKKAVNHISFEIEKNAITALIGPSGRGKSTFYAVLTA